MRLYFIPWVLKSNRTFKKEDLESLSECTEKNGLFDPLIQLHLVCSAEDSGYLQDAVTITHRPSQAALARCPKPPATADAVIRLHSLLIHSRGLEHWGAWPFILPLAWDTQTLQASRTSSTEAVALEEDWPSSGWRPFNHAVLNASYLRHCAGKWACGCQ